MDDQLPGVNSKLRFAVTTDNKSSEQDSNQSFFDVLNYGKGVDKDDPILSPMMNSPTGFMQQAFPGALDPGTPIIVLKQMGELGGLILGQPNTVKKIGRAHV